MHVRDYGLSLPDLKMYRQLIFNILNIRDNSCCFYLLPALAIVLTLGWFRYLKKPLKKADDSSRQEVVSNGSAKTAIDDEVTSGCDQSLVKTKVGEANNNNNNQKMAEDDRIEVKKKERKSSSSSSSSSSSHSSGSEEKTEIVKEIEEKEVELQTFVENIGEERVEVEELKEEIEGESSSSDILKSASQISEVVEEECQPLVDVEKIAENITDLNVQEESGEHIISSDFSELVKITQVGEKFRQLPDTTELAEEEVVNLESENREKKEKSASVSSSSSSHNSTGIESKISDDEKLQTGEEKVAEEIIEEIIELKDKEEEEEVKGKSSSSSTSSQSLEISSQVFGDGAEESRDNQQREIIEGIEKDNIELEGEEIEEREIQTEEIKEIETGVVEEEEKEVEEREKEDQKKSRTSSETSSSSSHSSKSPEQSVEPIIDELLQVEATTEYEPINVEEIEDKDNIDLEIKEIKKSEIQEKEIQEKEGEDRSRTSSVTSSSSSDSSKSVEPKGDALLQVKKEKECIAQDDVEPIEEKDKIDLEIKTEEKEEKEGEKKSRTSSVTSSSSSVSSKSVELKPELLQVEINEPPVIVEKLIEEKIALEKEDTEDKKSQKSSSSSSSSSSSESDIETRTSKIEQIDVEECAPPETLNLDIHHLAAIIVKDTHNLGWTQTICITSGSGVFESDRLDADDGTVLLDSRAAVLARRCLIKYLLDQLDSLITNKISRDESILKQVEASNRFRLKSNIRINILLSEIPDDEKLGVLRIKSVPDKISLWSRVGAQGSLLAHFVDPVLIDQIIVVTEPRHDSNEQQFMVNFNRDPKVLDCSKIKNEIAAIIKDFPAMNLATNWIIGDETPEIVDVDSGKAISKDQSGQIITRPSRLSKRQLFEDFNNFLSHYRPHLRIYQKSNQLNYRTWKSTAPNYTIQKSAWAVHYTVAGREWTSVGQTLGHSPDMFG